MLPINNVIWSEGMLLRQQHFQQQERYWSNMVAQRVGPLRSHQWGVVEYQIDKPLLETQRLQVNHASGVFPDGTAFSLSANQYHHLKPLDVPHDVQNTLVYLTLPLMNQQTTARYTSEAVELPDIFEDEIALAPVVIGKPNLALMLEGSDLSQRTSIPIARIKTCDAIKGIILDENFIAPCLTCSQNQQLNKFITELSSLLKHRAQTLAKRSLAVGSTNIADLSEFLLLQIINRYQAVFECLTLDSHTHPQSFYFYATQMMAELATYTHHDKTWEIKVGYHHHELQQSFEPLMRDLRQALNTVIEQPSVSISLTKTDGEQFMSAVIASDVLENAMFIIAVKADIPGERLQKQFPSQAKVAAPEQVQALINTQLPGIRMKPLSVILPQLPYLNGYYYYEFEQTGELWESICEAQQFGVHIGKQFPGIKLYCWAIKNKK